MLGIPLVNEEEPTDYQLLGIDDFENDPDKIADAHEKRGQQIATLYEIVSALSKKIDNANDRLTNPEAREEYDLTLRRTGRAGVAHLGRGGSLAVFSSFVLSIIIVIVTTFYIYPMVVPPPVEDYGDSVATLAENEQNPENSISDEIKERQQDIATLDVNLNIPIDVDQDASIDNLNAPAGSDNADSGLAPISPIDNSSSADDSLPTAENDLFNPPVGDPAEEPQTPDTEPAPDFESPENPSELALTPPLVDNNNVNNADEANSPEDSVPEFPNLDTDEQSSLPELPSIEDNETADSNMLPEIPSMPESVADIPATNKNNEPVTPPSLAEEASNLNPEIGASESEIPSVPQPGRNETTVNEPVKPDSAPLIVDNPVPEPPQPVFTGTPIAPVSPEADDFEIPVLPGVENTTHNKRAATDNALEIPTIEMPDELPTATNAAVKSGNNSNSAIVLEDVDRYDAILQLTKNAQTEGQFLQLLASSKLYEQSLMKEKAFDKAEEVAQLVYNACFRSAAGKQFRADALRQKEYITQTSKRWATVREALTKIDASGSRPSPFADIVAQWEIEIENNWTTAIQYLTLSQDERIRDAANKELVADATDVRSCLDVANKWWNVSVNSATLQNLYRAHACEWYAKVLPSVSDKQVRTLIEKRIAIAQQKRH